jgi:hypothetical protein
MPGRVPFDHRGTSQLVAVLPHDQLGVRAFWVKLECRRQDERATVGIALMARRSLGFVARAEPPLGIIDAGQNGHRPVEQHPPGIGEHCFPPAGETMAVSAAVRVLDCWLRDGCETWHRWQPG